LAYFLLNHRVVGTETKRKDSNTVGKRVLLVDNSMGTAFLAFSLNCTTAW